VTGKTRVALDISALQVDAVADRGIGRYVSAYASALARARAVEAALLVPELPPPSNLPGELVSADLVRWDSSATARRLMGGDGPVVHHVTAPFLHCRCGEAPCLGIAEHWAVSGAARVVTVYDLIPLRAPRHYLAGPGEEERYRARAKWVGEADVLLAISEHTRNEVIELLGCDPKKVEVAGSGVSSFFSPPDETDNELWQFHFGELEGRPYLLTVGGSDPRKNTERLVEALGILTARERDVHLVVVGDLDAPWRRRLLEAASAAGVEERVILSGVVGDDTLRAAYRRAVLTVMPSLAEGSGLPVLESAACGTPALASASTSLAEVAATPLATFDPASAESIAATVEAALFDDERRVSILSAQQDLASRSTWDAVAARASAAIDRLGRGASSGPGPTRRGRPAAPAPLRLALVGPLPPHGGGIGVYDRRFVEATPPDVRVEVVGAVNVDEAPAEAVVVAAQSFGVDVRPSSYDAVVYVLGNSEGHLRTLELALRYPGWLWLHEARLPGIVTSATAHLDDDEAGLAMTALLRRSYPGRPPLAAARRAGRSNLDLVAGGVGLLTPLAESCRGILVNSEVARRLVLLDLRPLAHHPPVVVLPQTCPPRPEPVRCPPRPIDDQTGALVVAFGIVSMAKRPDLLVDAVAAVGCRLAFVGPCVTILAETIVNRARARGIEDQVEVVGEVDAGGWRRWMEDADLAVQLRDTISGETSAALLEALSWGVPVLTNIASAAELPDGTVAFAHCRDSDSIAEAIRGLFLDHSKRTGLWRGGISFASSHQFDRLARELLDAVVPQRREALAKVDPGAKEAGIEHDL
jgi:glycosyltransferase involved in cell wall biosynthesis